jgi:hypothetical protein
MTKLKFKRRHLLIVVAFVASFAVIGVSVSQFGGLRGVSVSLLKYLFDLEFGGGAPDSFFDAFWYNCDAVGFKEASPARLKVNTELIPCSSDSNSYIRIDIHRNYGIPRFGIVTDCNGQILDTVHYTTSDFVRHLGTHNAPKFTDTSVTVWWEKTSFFVIVMNVLTGEPVVQEVCKGQPSSMFEGFWPDTVTFSDSVDASGHPVDTSLAITPANGEKFVNAPTSDNPGTTVNFSKIPNGLYFIFLIDGTGKVFNMTTINRGIERREIINGILCTGIAERKSEIKLMKDDDEE